MHPILAHRGRLGAYLLAWIAPAFLFAFLLAMAGTQQWWLSGLIAAPLTLVLAFICLASWYPCRVFPLQSNSILALIPVHLLGAALAAVFWWWVPGALWVDILQGSGLDAGEAWRAALDGFLLAAALLYLLSVVVHYLLAEVERARRAESRTQQLRMLAKDAELQALRAQVDPHFLFNSLNSVAALVGAAPQEARRMCERLGGFLRRTLELGDRQRVPLAEDLEIAREYLEIEKVRFDERLVVEVDLPSDAGGFAVPVLLLQPLVENAVRHGVAHRLDGGTIRIRARLCGGALEVDVENPVDADRPRGTGSGRGLANLRQRLAALYEGAASLETGEEGGLFRARLRLPAGGPGA